MIELILLLTFAFLFGLSHAAQADHVLAASSIVKKTKSFKNALSQGFMWGVGHTFSLMIAGIVVLLLGTNIPKNIELTLEASVGLVLVVLGISVLWQLKKAKLHSHSHTHGGITHTHVHSHAFSESHNHTHHLKDFKSLFVGMLQGLAGSAALMLVVLTTIDNFLLGVAYILLFGAGSIVGMMIVKAILCIPYLFSKSALDKSVSFAAGAASIVYGIVLFVRMIPWI